MFFKFKCRVWLLQLSLYHWPVFYANSPFHINHTIKMIEDYQHTPAAAPAELPETPVLVKVKLPHVASDCTGAAVIV